MKMKCATTLLVLAAAGIFLFSETAAAQDRCLSNVTQQELARARAATARYHDVLAAEADGYANIDLCLPGEGCHWNNNSFIDGTFDPEKPVSLLYVPDPGKRGMRLVAVEYLVPDNLPRPEGFTGDCDEWEFDIEGFPFWGLVVWLWDHNPDGLFSPTNPLVP